MASYDDWRLAYPAHYDAPEDSEIADFYCVELDEVTDRMRMNYESDRIEDAALREAELRGERC